MHVYHESDKIKKFNMFIIVSFSSSVGDDYQPVQHQLEFHLGETRKEFNVTIVDDNVIEDMESFQLSLSITDDIISKGVQLGPNAAANVTIMDNDGELDLYTCQVRMYTALPLFVRIIPS